MAKDSGGNTLNYLAPSTSFTKVTYPDTSLFTPRPTVKATTAPVTVTADADTYLVTVEDGVLDGGFGEKIARFYGNSDVKVLNYGLKKEFLDRYNAEEIVKANRLTPEQIAEDVCGIIG